MHPRALEVKTTWGDSVLDACTLCPVDCATFEGVAFVREPLSEDLTIEPAARYRGRIDRTRGGSVDLTASMLPYAIGARDTVVLNDGRITLHIKYVSRVGLHRPGLWDSIDYRWMNFWLLVFFVHALLATFALAVKPRGDLFDELHAIGARYVEVMLKPTSQPYAGRLSWPNAMPEIGKTRAIAAPRRGVEHGTIDAKKVIAALFKGGTNQIFGTGAPADGLENALGEVQGRDLNAGLSGFGTHGGGPGGSGLGTESVGPGELTGVGDVRDLIHALPRTHLEKSASEVSIDRGGPVHIEGSLPKDVIHEVIRRMIPQIQYCYERELQRMPGLFGKLSTEFVIGPTGAVTKVRAVQSTTGSPSLDACVVAKIAKWKFPEPRGGGEVLVKYPFIFKPAG